MKKFLLRAAGLCAAVGVALCIAGLLRGGRATGVEFTWKNGRPAFRYVSALNKDAAGSTADAVSSATQTASADLSGRGEIRSLDLQIGGARVELVPGDGWDLAVSGTKDYTKKIENGTLHIENDSVLPSDDAVFTLTFPAGWTLDEVSLEIGAGSLTARGLNCTELDLKVGAGSAGLTDCTVLGACSLEAGMGSVTYTGELAAGAEVDCGMGSVRCTVSEPPSWGAEVDCGVGSVHIGSQSWSGLGAETVFGAGAPVQYKVDCGLGTVEIRF